MKIELELTSACNAKCPLCMRTVLMERNQPVQIDNYTIKEIETYFKDMDLKGATIKFCGVLGDPIACRDLYAITEYFIIEKDVKIIEVSTNAGLKTKEFWSKFGQISKVSGKKLEVHFAIDGLTRNDYRVGVDLKKVWNNVNAYLDAGGSGVWQYIVFDYNEHELEDAKKLSKKKGMRFITRIAWKNQISKRDKAKIVRKSIRRNYD